MSNQQIFIAGYFPDKKSEEAGIKRVATAFNAKDIERAKAKANFIFLEEYEHAQDAAFKILVCADTPDVPGRPSRGTWDENFLYEYDWPEDVGHPVKRPAEKVDFDKLSSLIKIAVLVKYDSTEITKADLPAALELTQDEADTFEGHVVEAISKMPEIANMYPERIQHVIGWVGAKCDHSAKWPEIQKEISTWMKRQDGERKQTGSSKSVIDIARDKAAAEKLGQKKPAPVILQDAESLKRNIALGLLAKAMDFDILNPPASIVNRAREIIKLKEKPFPAWFAAMSATIGIYEYSTVQIIYSVKISDEGIDRTAGAIQGHINRTFTETDHANPSDEMLAIACGLKTEEGKGNETEQNKTGLTDSLDASASTPGSVESEHNGNGPATGPLENTTQVERTGPFYFLFADGVRVGRANKLPGLEKALADGGKEISQEEYQARKNGTFEQTTNQVPAQTSDANQPDVKNLGGGHFSIEGLAGNDSADKPSGETPTEFSEKESPVQPLPVQELHPTTPVEDFQSVGASLEQDIQKMTDQALDNLGIWRKVMRTDPRFTKQMSGTGFEGTSINAEYMIMRATEIFGPIGIRWGFEILEDRMIPGAPFSEPVYEDKKFVGNRFLRDGDGTLLFEQNHSLKIRFWYKRESEEGSILSYGATPYMFKTKNGIRCDGEVQKKSLTDALKKALSLLGFSADVWLGLYDLPEYQAENKVEFAIKHASEKAEDVTRLRSELDEKMTRVANTLENSVSPHEAKKVFDTLAREVEVHRKAAEAKGDDEHARYLSGRMRRLCQIKDQRLKALTEAQEQTA